jgi:3-oxoacyl-[acyl-carrier-protein] synthase II
MTSRAVITSFGIVGPMALDPHQFWDLVRSGQSAIRKIEHFDSSATGCYIAGMVPEFSLNFIPARFKPKRQSRHTHLLLKAGQQIRELVPKNGEFDMRIGFATSDLAMISDSGAKREREGYANACPIVMSQCAPHSASGALAMYLECRGAINTVSTACTSGMDSIGLAARDITTGTSNFVVAGGADAPVAMSPLAELVRSNLSTRRSLYPERSSRPFDAFADSGIISEAAGLAVVEDAEEAIRAGRQPLCEIVGHANANDLDPAVPGGGYVQAMRRALDAAGLETDEVDAIFAWGPGHPVLDRAEAEALEQVFGSVLPSIPVTSIKGVIGNPLAGAGPLQVAAAAFSLVEGIVPPTANYEVPLPGINLDIVVGQPLRSRPRNVLLNAHGIGGANVCLILRRWSNLVDYSSAQ